MFMHIFPFLEYTVDDLVIQKLEHGHKSPSGDPN